SAVITDCFRHTAVPHDPTHGPIASGVMAADDPLGTRGPDAGHSMVPSGSISNTVVRTFGTCASMVVHKVSNIAGRLAPPAIISNVRVSAAKSASARLSSSISVVVPYHLTILPWAS